MTRIAWWVVGLVFGLRAVAAFAVPLSGDEAYYWEWSRRLAPGYVDHPPLVALTIAAFSWLGANPGVVRLGFVLCGVLAALALAAAAYELTGNARAAAIAALALALTPLATLAFGMASPDGPYLLFWSLGLWAAVRAFNRGAPADWILLGVAFGGVVLARLLGAAFVAGVLAYALTARRDVFRGFGAMNAALFVAALVVAPFIVWNAAHEWVTFTFALVHRHEQIRHFSTLEVLGRQLLAYSPGICAAAFAAAARRMHPLIAWTAFPQFALVMLLSLFERVEIHWIFGFFVSLCLAIAVVYPTLSRRARAWWSAAAAVPAALLLSVIFIFSFAPVEAWQVVQHGSTARLRNNGPFEIFTYPMVARDAKRLTRGNGAVVMTDGYGFSSVLDFDAWLVPVVIGYDWQGREARNWFPSKMQPARALFVDKEPLVTRPDFAERFHRACTRVLDGGTHGYAYGGTAPRYYYFTWCEGMRPGGLSILRWERERPGPPRESTTNSWP